MEEPKSSQKLTYPSRTRKACSFLRLAPRLALGLRLTLLPGQSHPRRIPSPSRSPSRRPPAYSYEYFSSLALPFPAPARLFPPATSIVIFIPSSKARPAWPGPWVPVRPPILAWSGVRSSSSCQLPPSSQAPKNAALHIIPGLLACPPRQPVSRSVCAKTRPPNPSSAGSRFQTVTTSH